MNFALGVVIIVISLLPGPVFLESYLNSFQTPSASLHKPFAERAIEGIFFTLFIQAASVCIICLFCDIDFDLLYAIIINADGLEKFEDHMSLKNAFCDFALYNLIIISFSFCLGKLGRFIMRATNWNYKFYGLRCNNYWYEIFSGRYLRYIYNDNQLQTDLIVIDVLLNNGFLYSGLIIDYKYSRTEDKLEHITLKNTRRRHASKWSAKKDSTEANTAKKDSVIIPGERFIILWDEIVNINVSYLRIAYKE